MGNYTGDCFYFGLDTFSYFEGNQRNVWLALLLMYTEHLCIGESLHLYVEAGVMRIY